MITIKIKLGLVDSDRLYLKRLTEFIDKKYSSQIEIYSFDESPDAAELIRESRVNVLVVSQDSKIKADSLPESCMFAYFTESPEIDTFNGCVTLFRYQRGDALYRALLGLYSEKISDRIKYRSTDRARISLFLPECEGAGAFTAAAAFSECSAENGARTLFLNLRQFHSTEKLFCAPGSSSFTDVIFSVKSRKANMRLKLESIAQQSRSGVYFFGSCRSPLDAAELNSDELRFLLEELGGSCGYERIVIAADFFISDNLALLLECSDDIVIVSGGSRVSGERLMQKQAAVFGLGRRMQGDITDRIKVIFNKSDKAPVRGISCLGCVPDSGSDNEQDAVRCFAVSDVFRPLLGTEVM